MAIVPKRKTSKQRKHKRRTHDALKIQNLVSCKNCSNFIQQHRVCQFCGFYRDKIVEGYRSINSRNN
ncbi:MULTISPECIES: 50S ribosomal protein L32 [unclassified Mycoplasma]|uniref:50S ribosomal protein L32 n=1 Tax=unclassified Mycoplasma TaxID=2683645 RepID=UPI00216AB392|nr:MULTISPECIES: 50S ribosomal protein L32 [unclassified Mycoplasma]MCS4536925.1 50S ribosomal protein L32 [Mycoplasma sp. CSL7475-4]MCT4469455.1 50S ribosomal protein L32 [Mycoplasma sp. HS2188]